MALFYRGKRIDGRWVYGKSIITASDGIGDIVYILAAGKHIVVSYNNGFEEIKSIVSDLAKESVGYKIREGTLCHTIEMNDGMLKDKNGNMVYTGDILSCKGAGTIIIKNMTAQWTDSMQETPLVQLHIDTDYQIIGNIFDTPELAKSIVKNIDFQNGIEA